MAKNKLSRLFWLLPALILTVSAQEVMERESLRFDSPFLLFLHAHSSPFFDPIMLAFSLAGGLWTLAPTLALGLVLGQRNRKREAIFVAASWLGAGVLNVVTKEVFRRERPHFWPSLAPESDFGFPSGHAMLSLALAGAVIILLWRGQISRSRKILTTFLAALFVLGVGFSRLYLGVHFPSDVLAGWCFSLLWLGVSKRILSANLPFSQLALRN